VTNSTLDRRIRYIKAGHEPLPCEGKRPVVNDWSTIPIDLTTPAEWEDSFPAATNTGIRTKHTPAIDIDVYDSIMATQLEEALRRYFPEQVLLVRYGNLPKRLVPFRCDVPFRKIAVKFKAPDDDETIHTVEVLADGQQFIADGVNPDVNKSYRWKDGDLLSVPRESLHCSIKTARQFIAQATKIADGVACAKRDRPTAALYDLRPHRSQGRVRCTCRHAEGQRPQ
jgi:hypothetical protein